METAKVMHSIRKHYFKYWSEFMAEEEIAQEWETEKGFFLYLLKKWMF